MRIFVDTSAIIALMIESDSNHESARRWLESQSPRPRFVTSTDVFDETITRHRILAGHGRAVALGRAMREGEFVEVVPVDATDRERAWALFEQRDKVRLSHTDCTIAAVMERLGIETVFTFDEGFRALGKTVVP